MIQIIQIMAVKVNQIVMWKILVMYFDAQYNIIKLMIIQMIIAMTDLVIQWKISLKIPVSVPAF